VWASLKSDVCSLAVSQDTSACVLRQKQAQFTVAAMHARCARMMQYKGNCILSTVRQEFYIHICNFKGETGHGAFRRTKRHLGEELATYVFGQKQLTIQHSTQPVSWAYILQLSSLQSQLQKK